MANSLTDVIPKILSAALPTLRANAVMPQIVNTQYSPEPGVKGSTIDITLPPTVGTNPVTPGHVAPDTDGIEPTTVPLVLDQWQEAPFDMSDKDLSYVQNGTIPSAVEAAVVALSEWVNDLIFQEYKRIYGYTGTAGTTPFGTGVETASATQARKILNQQKAPLSNRYFVMDPDAEAVALGLRAFQDASFRGDTDGIREGKLARKFGFDFMMDQAVPLHVAGTITTGLIAKAATGQAAGLTTIVGTTAASTGACNLKVGDIISINGHSQTYTLTAAAVQASANTDVNISISPPLQVALVGSESITVKASHRVNLAINRDCIAFGSRVLSTGVGPEGMGSIAQSIFDPVTRLILRLEVSREYKQTRWSFDILCGARCMRPELGVRVAG